MGQTLTPGAVVLLQGPLGAGKTVLAKGIAAGLGVTDTVTSPTYTFAVEYAGRIPIVHADLYRLEEPEQFDALALDDRLGTGSVLLIEWPERAQGFLPPNATTLLISLNPDGSRTIERMVTGDE